MNFGVGGHLNVEFVVGFGANEGDQIAGVMELATCAIAAGQITAQGHQAFDAHGLERGQFGAHRSFGRTNARKVRSRSYPFAQDGTHCGKCAFLCRAPSAVGH